MDEFAPTSTGLRQLARALGQQMVWWGHDVNHPQGNLLVLGGLERLASPGLKGTSCYRADWEGGWVELHGAVASWTSAPGGTGVMFSRERARVELWAGSRPPIPGKEVGVHADASTRGWAALPLIRWVADYEDWVHDTIGPEWRLGCWRALRRLPKARRWLPPAEARDWWRRSRETAALQRFACCNIF
jgi:hypothetical protein